MKFLAILFVSICVLVRLNHAHVCGIQRFNQSTEGFIIGGEDAQQGEFPWFVSYAGCGAALVREEWVLTAAHCLMYIDDKDINQTKDTQFNSAYVDIFNNKNLLDHQVKVLKVISHEDFNFTLDYDKQLFTVKNDLGLIKIDPSTLKLNKNLMPICLPDENITLTNECWIAGFGDDNSTNHMPTTLKKLKDWVSDDQKCLEVDKAFNRDQQICIGGTAQGGRGACHGDSGSAFQCKATDGRFYQLGITSSSSLFSGACAQPNAPDIYTRVSHYIEWIERTIENN